MASSYLRGGPRLGLATFTARMTAVMAAGSFVPFVFSTLGPTLVDDLALGRAAFGALTTVLFAVAAALSPAMGWVVDRVATRRAYTGHFLLSAAVLGGIALAPSYALLVACAGAAGIAQAFANPLSNRLIAEHVPAPRQGVVIGVKQSGVQVGMVLAGLSLPVLAVAVGWRAGVAWVAAIVLLGWAASVRSTPDYPAHGGAGERARPAGAGRAVLVFAACSYVFGSAMAALTAYLPLYAHESLAVSTPVAGALVGTAGAVGIAARVLVGHTSDRLGEPVLLLEALAWTATAAVGLVLLAASFGTAALWLGTLCFGVSMAWNAVAMITVVRAAGPQHAGRASGAVMGAFFAGFIVAPVLVGAVVDASGSYVAPWSAVLAAMVVTAASLHRWRRAGAGGWGVRAPHARP